MLKRFATRAVLIEVRVLRLAIILTCFIYVSCSGPPPRVVSVMREDSLVFKGKAGSLDGLDTVIEKTHLGSLRNQYVADDDLEVRIWRGFGLQPLECVVIRRTRGNWSGYHIITDDYVTPKNVQVIELTKPKSGWDNLWTSLKEKGVLELSPTDDDSCRGQIDGISYVVEINEKRTYRNYKFPEGNQQCAGSPQMTRIGEIVGVEFDDGKQECANAEWLPCATYQKNRGIEYFTNENQ